MKSFYLVAVLLLSSLVLGFSQEQDGRVCERAGGECLDAEDNEDCKHPMGPLDCPNEEQCCRANQDGRVCESAGGECLDEEEENESCEVPMGPFDCPNKEKCCVTETARETPALLSNRYTRCPTWNACREIGGDCRRIDLCDEPLTPPGPPFCKEKCVCCKPTCNEGHMKLQCKKAKGHCNFTCEPDLRILPNGCRGEHCNCCAPPCKITDECNLLKGWCANGIRDCATNITLKDGCIGFKCVCCLPPPPPNCTLTATPTCLDVYEGECQANGCDETGEKPRLIPNECTHKDCYCCAGPCIRKDNCKRSGRKGTCISLFEECLSGDIKPNACKGAGCQCCIPAP